MANGYETNQVPTLYHSDEAREGTPGEIETDATASGPATQVHIATPCNNRYKHDVYDMYGEGRKVCNILLPLISSNNYVVTI